jgi:hypothetical protein
MFSDVLLENCTPSADMRPCDFLCTNDHFWASSLSHLKLPNNGLFVYTVTRRIAIIVLLEPEKDFLHA